MRLAILSHELGILLVHKNDHVDLERKEDLHVVQIVRPLALVFGPVTAANVVQSSDHRDTALLRFIQPLGLADDGQPSVDGKSQNLHVFGRVVLFQPLRELVVVPTVVVFE